MATKVKYKDLDFNFDFLPTTKNLVVRKNEEAIKQSLMNLIFTNVYERKFNSTLGAGLEDYLFENFDFLTEINIDRAIRQIIAAYEPRVSLVDVTVYTNIDENELNVTLEYFIVGLTELQKFDFILERVR
jgi:phage baseplate assembly protein W